ncbi:MAG: raffinose/stachyose/melibiose transport system substrate-binding protein [Actinomycetota bacterium]|nr:raffinose/stachyose/melibiose transport system substrate-binding protein [Actinomycetota bacterium]
MSPVLGSTPQWRRRRAAGIGVVAVASLMLAACGGGSSGGSASGGASGDSNKPVKLVFWHNANSEPGLSWYKKVADDYTKAHPNVTIEQVPLQSEDMKAKIRVAMQSNNPPDLFHQWGGGQMKEQIDAGKLMDLTEATSSWIGELGSTPSNWQLNGKTYGIPYSAGAVGFWYRKDLFTKAGVTAAPKTVEELLAAAAKIKAAGIEPIAIGAKDKWPAAFWYDYYVVRACQPKVLTDAVSTLKFDDACWLDAAKEFQKVATAQPFNKGYLGTSAQQGAGSSAGQLATGKAAMELMGQWNPSVIQSLTTDQKALSADKLGWFPFPTVSSLKGTQDGVLGGGDGYSCSAKAPKECVDFLKFFVSADVQKDYTKVIGNLPVNKGASVAVTDPNLKLILEARDKAPLFQTYLDVAFGQEVGDALNEAVVQQLAGKATPEQVVKAIQTAAEQAQ